jgi:hypothetical protein
MSVVASESFQELPESEFLGSFSLEMHWDVETQPTKPLEEELNNITGVTKITSNPLQS